MVIIVIGLVVATALCADELVAKARRRRSAPRLPAAGRKTILLGLELLVAADPNLSVATSCAS